MPHVARRFLLGAIVAASAALVWAATGTSVPTHPGTFRYAGSADLERLVALRPEIKTEVAAQLIPNWTTARAKAIAARSAIRFFDRLPPIMSKYWKG